MVAASAVGKQNKRNLRPGQERRGGGGGVRKRNLCLGREASGAVGHRAENFSGGQVT